MRRSDDERFMRVALQLAARARGRTSPNPLVGAVVVREGQIVGRGYHRRAGSPHAEVEALRQAGEQAVGAELYVNLEPCNHVGRTGPCVKCILEARVRRVVVGMRDPNPLVNGRGIRALRRGGVEVETGVLEEAARLLNETFLFSIVTRRPFVVFKAAVTLDGKVAARSGDARWVTGEQARAEGHRWRNRLDAILVGVGTVLADDPELTCRGVPGGRDPLRVVVDSKLRTPVDAAVIRAAGASTAASWILTTDQAPAGKQRLLEQAGARVFRLPADAEGQVALLAVLDLLYEQGVMSVLLEGGPRLAGGFWRLGLVDRVLAFVAPKLLGDAQGLSMLAGGLVGTMAEATRLQQVTVRRLGDDLLVSGRVQRRTELPDQAKLAPDTAEEEA